MACKNKQLCTSVEDPLKLTVNLSKVAVTFWERVSFLIEDEGIQRYAPKTSFRSENVCIIRGQIVTKHGRGLPGVRISREGHFLEGFTLSRSDGYFDFMANCEGRKVRLKFGKSPFPFQTKSFEVNRNKVSILNLLQIAKTANSLLAFTRGLYVIQKLHE